MVLQIITSALDNAHYKHITDLLQKEIESLKNSLNFNSDTVLAALESYLNSHSMMESIWEVSSCNRPLVVPVRVLKLHQEALLTLFIDELDYYLHNFIDKKSYQSIDNDNLSEWRGLIADLRRCEVFLGQNYHKGLQATGQFTQRVAYISNKYFGNILIKVIAHMKREISQKQYSGLVLLPSEVRLCRKVVAAQSPQLYKDLDQTINVYNTVHRVLNFQSCQDLIALSRSITKASKTFSQYNLRIEDLLPTKYAAAFTMLA